MCWVSWGSAPLTVAGGGDGTGANSTAAASASETSPNENANAPESPQTPRGRRGKKTIAYIKPAAAFVRAAAAYCVMQPATSIWTASEDSCLHFAPDYHSMVTRHCSTYDVTESDWSVFAENKNDFQVFREAAHLQTIIYV